MDKHLPTGRTRPWCVRCGNTVRSVVVDGQEEWADSAGTTCVPAAKAPSGRGGLRWVAVSLAGVALTLGVPWVIIVTQTPPVDTGAVIPPTMERITEDDPRWDCLTMGDRVCGPSLPERGAAR